MKENKQYKLKRWYPSLHPEWKHEEITVEKTKDGNYVNFMDCQVVPKHEVENNPDFWEEVKQPLFVTDDGIEIFDDTTEIIIVSIKHYTVSKIRYKYLSKPLNRENFKHFGIEANADKYIEDHKPKPLFITEDGVEVFDRDEYFTIGYDFNKRNMIAYDCDAPYSTDVIRFKHESNADEYIAWYKKEFSINDLLLADVGITTSQLDKLQELAKKKE